MSLTYQGNGLEIAVIGMAGRFPGAPNIEQFWENLKNGVEAITFFSQEELLAAGVSQEELNNPNYVMCGGGVLENIAYFDAGFFGYSPVEAELMDPQVRIFHECAWHALENAGYNPFTYDKLIGLYAGASFNLNWEAAAIMSGKSAALGNFTTQLLLDRDYLCTRISYNFNLKGPGVVVKTACSTSLVAVHMACQSILNGECNLALAGGVTITQLKKTGYLYQEGLILSQDGHCRAFAGNSTGTVSGNGAGVVVLKRLEDAVNDGDTILAMIKGSAINNDGFRKVGFTAPSVEGQCEVICDALCLAEVEPETITYVETHGTGTPVGDPIEMEALKLAFNTPKKQYCRIGSVKTNIGHLDVAAGIAGFIKTVLALKHKLIPPILHFKTPNPRIDFENSPFIVNTELFPWQNNGQPLRAGVSSFGIGGTNAHVVLEEYNRTKGAFFEKTAPLTPEKTFANLILLSARSQTALDRMAKNLAAYLKENKDIELADVAYTLQVGRRALPYRRMAICPDIDSAIVELSSPVLKDRTSHAKEIEPSQELKPLLAQLTEGDENFYFINKLGQLWLQGMNIDWQALYQNGPGRRIPLPLYPFDGQEYWPDGDQVDPPKSLPVPKKIQKAVTKKADLADWFYTQQWLRSPLIAKKILSSTGCWLLFSDDSSLAKQLLQDLRAAQQHVIIVNTGESFAEAAADEYCLNPGNPDDYVNLFKTLAEMGKVPRYIMHLWCLPGHPKPGSLGLGLFSLLDIARAIGAATISEKIQLAVITSNMQYVTGEEKLVPEKAALLGPVKIIPLEYPNIACRSIDITHPGEDPEKIAFLAENLPREFCEFGEFCEISSGFKEHPVIAYRGACRWQETFEPVRLTIENKSPAETRLKEKGVYLVTGGFGGMGFTLAEHLLNTLNTRLILLDALTPPSGEKLDTWLYSAERKADIEAKKQKITAWISRGAEIMVHDVDVADYGRMKEVIGQAEARFGKINGVIHTAGLIDYAGVIQRRTHEMTEALLSAKIKGTLILDELLNHHPLDFMVLFSSIGNVYYDIKFGQVGYNAGHEFMDAFAYYKHQQGRFTVTIDWNDWTDVGMAARAAQKRDAEKHNDSINDHSNAPVNDHILAISPAEGIAVFQRIIENNIPRVVVFQHDLNRLMEILNNPAESETGKKPEPKLYERPELSTGYLSSSNDLEQFIIDIWAEAFGFKNIGINDDFFELGGDSLVVVQIISRLKEAYAVEISMDVFFENPTVAQLAQKIKELLIRKVQNLSEEELDALAGE